MGLEILALLSIISGIIWLFGIDGWKILACWFWFLAVIFGGIVLGIGIQISYVLFPIAGG